MSISIDSGAFDSAKSPEEVHESVESQCGENLNSANGEPVPMRAGTVRGMVMKAALVTTPLGFLRKDLSGRSNGGRR